VDFSASSLMVGTLVVLISLATGILGAGSNGGRVDFEVVVLSTGSSAGGGGFTLAVFMATPTSIERRRRLLVSSAYSMGGGCTAVATLGSEYRIRLVRL